MTNLAYSPLEAAEGAEVVGIGEALDETGDIMDACVEALDETDDILDAGIDCVEVEP